MPARHAIQTAVALLSIAAAIPAQRVLHSRLGSEIGAHLGRLLVAPGDLDGDQINDFVVTADGNGGFGTDIWRATAISGATGSTLYEISSGVPQDVNGVFAGIGDVNNDGVPDLLGWQSGGAVIYSGADGSVVRAPAAADQVTGELGCNVGDQDGDGVDDFAATALLQSTNYIGIYSGADGSRIRVIFAWLPNDVHDLMSIDDVTGDGLPELLVVATRTPVLLLDAATDTIVQQFGRMPSRIKNPQLVTTADVDGDGRDEVLLMDEEASWPNGKGAIMAYSTSTGALVRTIHPPTSAQYSSIVAPLTTIGDLDRDGSTDFFVFSGFTNQPLFLSGRTGEELSTLPEMPGFNYVYDPTPIVERLGDVDTDGFEDVVLATTDGQPSSRGGWQLISGRVLAYRVTNAVNCASGPFLPELGVSPPRLGQLWTIAGERRPLGTAGTVFLSSGAHQPISLGVPGCELWLDVGTAVPMFRTPTTSSWSITAPLPLIPQLAGVELSLQAVYGPTPNPIGVDLTNGVRTRIGY